MDTLFLAASNAEVIPVVAIVGGLLVALTSIIAGSIRRVYLSKDREQSRREIAAYVAEGSMSAEEGERLMNAGTSKRDKSCD